MIVLIKENRRERVAEAITDFTLFGKGPSLQFNSKGPWLKI